MKIALVDGTEFQAYSARVEYNPEYQDSTEIYADIIIKDSTPMTVDQLKIILTPENCANIVVTNASNQTYEIVGYTEFSDRGFEMLVRLIQPK